MDSDLFLPFADGTGNSECKEINEYKESEENKAYNEYNVNNEIKEYKDFTEIRGQPLTAQSVFRFPMYPIFKED